MTVDAIKGSVTEPISQKRELEIGRELAAIIRELDRYPPVEKPGLDRLDRGKSPMFRLRRGMLRPQSLSIGCTLLRNLRSSRQVARP
jgi:hypothetical protein